MYTYYRTGTVRYSTRYRLSSTSVPLSHVQVHVRGAVRYGLTPRNSYRVSTAAAPRTYHNYCTYILPVFEVPRRVGCGARDRCSYFTAQARRTPEYPADHRHPLPTRRTMTGHDEQFTGCRAHIEVAQKVRGVELAQTHAPQRAAPQPNHNAFVSTRTLDTPLRGDRYTLRRHS
jgi:hypothetical protein